MISDLTDAVKDLLFSSSLKIFSCGLYIYFWFTEL